MLQRAAKCCSVSPGLAIYLSTVWCGHNTLVEKGNSCKQMGTPASLGIRQCPRIDSFKDVNMGYMKSPLSGLSDFFKELV